MSVHVCIYIFMYLCSRKFSPSSVLQFLLVAQVTVPVTVQSWSLWCIAGYYNAYSKNQSKTAKYSTFALPLYNSITHPPRTSSSDILGMSLISTYQWKINLSLNPEWHFQCLYLPLHIDIFLQAIHITICM